MRGEGCDIVSKTAILTDGKTTYLGYQSPTKKAKECECCYVVRNFAGGVRDRPSAVSMRVGTSKEARGSLVPHPI